MNKLFSKKDVYKVKSLPYNPASIAEPIAADDYRQRGTAHYARKQFQEAVADLEQATKLDSNDIDAFYMLGMVYKAMKQNEHAVLAFTQVLELVKEHPDGNNVRNDMLRRLALGHINAITQGDWNLEKEIWKRKT
jgi:tetratricopeptide (TPR) repeat protein